MECRAYGAWDFIVVDPMLTHWAKFFRASGAACGVDELCFAYGGI